MQERNIDGSYGEPVPFEVNEMKNKLADPNVDYVEVFNNTPDEMSKRRLLFEQQQSAIRKKRKQKNRIQNRSRKNSR